MTRYEERLAHDLDQIKRDVAAVGVSVEQALRNAIQALLHNDEQLAYATVLGDNPINREVRRLDRVVLHFIIKHLPSAGHLRYVSTVLRMNISLERLGDYAATIAREAVALKAPLEGVLRREVVRMSEDALEMFKQAMQAYNEGNADLARGTKPMEDQIDRAFSMAFEDLVETGRSNGRSLKDLFGILSILNAIERVSDLSKNICEDTIFAVTGESKKTKQFRILILDKENKGVSHMAAAIGTKTYPNSGAYTAVGVQAADAFEPSYLQFMADHGFDVADAKPRLLDLVPSEWDNFHIVISLDGPIQDYVEETPFHTSVLVWDVPKVPPAGMTDEEVNARYEEIYRQLALNISDLMHTLHGEEAS